MGGRREREAGVWPMTPETFRAIAQDNRSQPRRNQTPAAGKRVNGERPENSLAARTFWRIPMKRDSQEDARIRAYSDGPEFQNWSVMNISGGASKP